jgi:hypothetical protein
VTFYVWLPSRTQQAQVTFAVHSDDSPDPDPSNDKATVVVRPFDD